MFTSSILSGVSWLVFTVAFCLSHVQVRSEEYDTSLAWRMMQYCGAAYCCDTALGGRSCKRWTCRACHGSMDVTEIVNSTTRGNGFVGYDNDDQEIIVSFSGTNPIAIKNWIEDIDTVKTSYTLHEGCVDSGGNTCGVHKGFFKTYVSVREQVLEAVGSYAKRFPNHATVRVTGHSLGGALAMHGALDLKLEGYNVTSMYSFGQPRTGDSTFADFFTSSFLNSGAEIYRVTHWKDPVPALPWEKWGFHHEPTEVFYNQRNSAYTVCDGSGEDKSCSDQFKLPVNVIDHLTYLGFDVTANYLSCVL